MQDQSIGDQLLGKIGIVGEEKERRGEKENAPVIRQSQN